MLKGLVQIYTGNGKGKTTAALGQGFRSAGRGLKVYMIQFLKSADSGELHSACRLEDAFKIFRFESPRDFFWKLDETQKEALKKEIRQAFDFAKTVMEKKECDVLILDEIMGTIHNKLIEEQELCSFIANKHPSVELILTGRNAPESVIAMADYVSEMNPIKHPMEKGIAAREGIEY